MRAAIPAIFLSGRVCRGVGTSMWQKVAEGRMLSILRLRAIVVVLVVIVLFLVVS